MFSFVARMGHALLRTHSDLFLMPPNAGNVMLDEVCHEAAGPMLQL